MVLVKKLMKRILKDQNIILRWKAKFFFKKLEVNMCVSGIDHENNAKTKRTKSDQKYFNLSYRRDIWLFDD